VAAYLRGEAESAPAGEKLLERLSAPQAAPAPKPATPVETVDQEKLAALSKPSEPTPVTPAPESKGPAAHEELRKADEKLSSLLGKKE